jgi:saccharopine dehydrogenase (NAD+, L-lysine-forming)
MPSHSKNRPTVWLRAECLELETRTPLTPADAATLIEQGMRVVVERSKSRCFDDRAYRKVGCELVPAETWPTAPKDALILGMKELSEDPFALKHQHMFYGHAFKAQRDAIDILERFVRGGGELIDFEFLKTSSGAPVASTGYWAGFAGAGLAAWAWAEQKLNRTRKSGEGYLPSLTPFESKEAFCFMIEKRIDAALAKFPAPRMLLTGGTGMVGRGAQDFLAQVGLKADIWGSEQTRAGGPFPEMLRYNVLIHAVAMAEPASPFLHAPLLQTPSRELTVVSDISCDLGNPYNVLPIYDRTTSLETPVRRLFSDSARPLDLIAIDRLPALLPKECSENFSSQLLPLLMDLKARKSSAWGEAERAFLEASAPLRAKRRKAGR